MGKYGYCIVCGKTAGVGHTKFCSDKCCTNYRLLSKQKKDSDVALRICPICGNEFYISLRGRGGKTRKYCCDECLLVAKRSYVKKAARKIYDNTTRGNIHRHKTDIGCQLCGYNKCGAALEWHHINKDDKSLRFTHTGYFSDEQELEREKCILLCSNCHKELHWNEKYILYTPS